MARMLMDLPFYFLYMTWANKVGVIKLSLLWFMIGKEDPLRPETYVMHQLLALILFGRSFIAA